MTSDAVARRAEYELQQLTEALGSMVAERYAAAEATMIARVAGFIVDELGGADTAIARRKVVAQLAADGERIAAALNDPLFLRRVVALAAEEGRAAAAAQAGIPTPRVVPVGQAAAVEAVAIDLTMRLGDMTQRISRWMPDVYQRVIGMVVPPVLAGDVTFQQAQRRAGELFLARGVNGFTDAAGREWRIGTYAEMATRTAVIRSFDESSQATLLDVGMNLCTIVVGGGACKFCAAVSGKVWSLDGTPSGTYTMRLANGQGTTVVVVAGSLDQARALGWRHPNCRCQTVGYSPGLPITGGTTFDPKAAADRERLRTLERRKRDQKRREAAAFDDFTRKDFASRIRQTDKAIREHVDSTGLQRRRYREQLGFSDGPTRKLPQGGPPRAVV